MASVLAYLAAALIALWGVAHTVPTRAVISGFEPISRDNRLVITQEWVLEAVTMWFVAAIVSVATAVGGGSTLTGWLYRVTAILLVVSAAWTALTGARTSVVWFKICVGLLTVTAALLVAASLVG